MRKLHLRGDLLEDAMKYETYKHLTSYYENDN